jgi:hypothetical protein
MPNGGTGDTVFGWVRLACLVMLTCGSGSAAGQALPSNQRSPLDPVRREQVQLLQEFGLAPVLLPRGQRVGDIYDMQNGILFGRAAECFPGLQATFEPTTLPTIRRSAGADLEAAIGLGAVANATLNAEASRGFELSFEDARVASATLVSLGERLSPVCAFVRPMLRLEPAAFLQAENDLSFRRFLVVAEVYEARRVIRLRQQTAGDAQASASRITQLLARIGSSQLRGSVSVTAGNLVEIRDEARVPVALRPVTVPILTTPGVTLGGPTPQNLSTPRPTVSWEPFEHDLSRQREVLAEWLLAPRK